MKFIKGIRADEIVVVLGGDGIDPLKVCLRNGDAYTFKPGTKFSDFVPQLEKVLAEDSAARPDAGIPYDLIRVVDSLRAEVKKLKCEIRKSQKDEGGSE